MPSKQTTNYKLSQWVRTDKVLMDDFNADNLAIDAALAAKAEQKDLTALQTVVSKKAEQTDVSALQTAMSGKGNCRIYIDSYIGNGDHGSPTPNSLTFPGKPMVVFIGAKIDSTTLIAIYGQTTTFSQASAHSATKITWTDNTMTWHNGNHVNGQMNISGETYTVVALIAES